MAKFKRFDPQNKKAARKNHRSNGKQSHHMETKYFRQQRNEEWSQILDADVDDYLGDHHFG
jgi:hypothetical protein